jgi:hypothetical protein
MHKSAGRFLIGALARCLRESQSPEVNRRVIFLDLPDLLWLGLVQWFALHEN